MNVIEKNWMYSFEKSEMSLKDKLKKTAFSNSHPWAAGSKYKNFLYKNSFENAVRKNPSILSLGPFY